MSQDVHRQWIQAKRQNTKTSNVFPCPLCENRRVLTSSDSLYEHAKTYHPEHVPLGEDAETLRNWRREFEEKAAKKNPSNDLHPRKPILNEANRAQPEPPPGKRPFSNPEPFPPTRTLSGPLGALNLSSTPHGSDEVTMRDVSEDDRQTPDLPRKRVATADKVSNGSASPFREQSPENPVRRSKARPISNPSNVLPEDARRSDGFESARPTVVKRQLWTADQTTSSPRTKVDPSNVASIQARKNRQQAPRLTGDNPTPGQAAHAKAAHAKSRSQEQHKFTTPEPQQNIQSPQRIQRSPQEETYSLLPQFETRPISQEQLVAEVKGIYAGLVMVEARCMEVDNKHATSGQGDPKAQSKLNNEQWQALIALHRTLLHEHHDFFLASQHPSASIALRRLASKYAMPARMWRHGIHSFLELLRHRLPASLDHMLAFIYLAYSMMALLYETVPAFEDTWIECLGDLARYRMAIEDDDIRDREVWTGVARQWYSKASNKAPTTGRLYHHLAILARPNALQQLFYYSKSLCVELPFISARESILTLFDPVLNATGPAQYRLPPLETAFVKAHGLLFTGRDTGKDLDIFEETVSDFLGLVDSQIGRVTRKFLEQGYHIATANCVAMLGFASKDSVLMKSISPPEMEGDAEQKTPEASAQALASFRRVERLFNKTLQIVLQRIGDPNVLTYIHVTLVFLFYLSEKAEAMNLIQRDFPWDLLATTLNTFRGSCKDPTRIESESFPLPEKEDPRPLPDDYAMRGLLWAVPYFPEQWFSNSKIDEDEKYREVASMTDERKERISWLACMISKRGPWLSYSRDGFSAQGGRIPPLLPVEIESEIKGLESRTPTDASATTVGSVERKQTWETATESEAERDLPSPRGIAAIGSADD